MVSGIQLIYLNLIYIQIDVKLKLSIFVPDVIIISDDEENKEIVTAPSKRRKLF